MVFKKGVGMWAIVLACASAVVHASDTTVLPETFTPEGDVVVCPESDEQAMEYILLLVTNDLQGLQRSTCSVVPAKEVYVTFLEIPLLLQTYTHELCDASACIESSMVGVYQAIAYGRFVMHAIGPEPVKLGLMEVRYGLQAGVEYEAVPAPSIDQYMLTEHSMIGVHYL